jgi:DNA invertase Pin-like site-specific DNA recombinase
MQELQKSGYGSAQKCFDRQTADYIFELHKQGWTYQQLADKFHCVKGTIKRYCTEYRRGKNEVQNI